MYKYLIFSIMFLILPCSGNTAELYIKTSKGANNVQLLSPGTSSVLDHMHANLDTKLKNLEARYKIEQLKKDVDKAKAWEAQLSERCKDEVISIKDRYISKISIEIVSARAEISPESSALGEIVFSYTAKNNSDRIIGDIVYRPMIGDIVAPTPSTLILEFIDPKTFKFGLPPGGTITNMPGGLERVSFFIEEISNRQLEFIKAHISDSFRIDIIDLRFLNKIGYKDQTKVMDVEEAFKSQLKSLLDMARQAQVSRKMKEEGYKKALDEYNQARDKVVAQFKNASGELGRASFRYGAKEDKNNKYMFKKITQGRYIVYAKAGKDLAIFQPVEIRDTKQELTVDNIIKDPFLP